jgi:hypothetical protein
MEPYYKLALVLCRLQHMYFGQPYARADFIPQSETKNFTSVNIGAEINILYSKDQRRYERYSLVLTLPFN